MTEKEKEAARLQKLCISAKDRDRLERAMCTLIDFEGSIKDAMLDCHLNSNAFHDVCQGLRHIVDGD